MVVEVRGAQSVGLLLAAVGCCRLAGWLAGRTGLGLGEDGGDDCDWRESTGSIGREARRRRYTAAAARSQGRETIRHNQ